jgi:hypothetical protein
MTQPVGASSLWNRRRVEFSPDASSRHQRSSITIEQPTSTEQQLNPKNDEMAANPITQAAVDDLFNFDSTDDENPFNDNQKPSRAGRDDKPTLSPRHKRKAENDEEPGADLGLDEEVKITKRRKPIAKLDEAR